MVFFLIQSFSDFLLKISYKEETSFTNYVVIQQKLENLPYAWSLWSAKTHFLYWPYSVVLTCDLKVLHSPATNFLSHPLSLIKHLIDKLLKTDQTAYKLSLPLGSLSPNPTHPLVSILPWSLARYTCRPLPCLPQHMHVLVIYWHLTQVYLTDTHHWRSSRAFRMRSLASSIGP